MFARCLLAFVRRGVIPRAHARDARHPMRGPRVGCPLLFVTYSLTLFEIGLRDLIARMCGTSAGSADLPRSGCKAASLQVLVLPAGTPWRICLGQCRLPAGCCGPTRRVPLHVPAMQAASEPKPSGIAKRLAFALALLLTLCSPLLRKRRLPLGCHRHW